MTDTSGPLAEMLRHLDSGGVAAALRFLNGRTPHRFTGIYRYDGDMLRNVALFDRFEPEQLRGIDIPLADAYCANVGRMREPLEFADAQNDGRFPYLPGSPVVCYCGVLMTTPEGIPYGTLCHYDIKPCQSRKSDLPLLKAAASHLYDAVEGLRQPG